MASPTDILRAAQHVIVVDFPDPDVPESLARAGLTVTVYGGPDPDDVQETRLVDGQLVTRQVGRRPESADVVYAFRPVDELPGILQDARRTGAGSVWWQSGVDADGRPDPRGCASTADSEHWRAGVGEAGLVFVDDVYIGDVARAITS